jgi:hypothetical protein
MEPSGRIDEDGCRDSSLPCGVSERYLEFDDIEVRESRRDGSENIDGSKASAGLIDRRFSERDVGAWSPTLVDTSSDAELASKLALWFIRTFRG